MIRRISLSFAALGLALAPAVAQARGSAPVEEENSIVGNPWIPIAIGIAVIAAILFVALDDDDPASP